jgi:hydrogenase expression/formation protein HypC
MTRPGPDPQPGAVPPSTVQPGAVPPSTVQPGAVPPSTVQPSTVQPSTVQPSTVQPPECHDEVCITCSDTAVAVTIARLLPDGLAVVDTEAGQEEVSVALVSAGVGDTILVHAGEAIAVVPT